MHADIEVGAVGAIRRKVLVRISSTLGVSYTLDESVYILTRSICLDTFCDECLSELLQEVKEVDGLLDEAVAHGIDVLRVPL